MDKLELKKILLSMENSENGHVIANLLGKLDKMTDEQIQEKVNEIGNSEEKIKEYVLEIVKKQLSIPKHYPLNSISAYGVSGNSVHLHTSGNLRKMRDELGVQGLMDNIKLSILDAIDRVNKMKKDGFYRLKDVEEIYMISPIFYTPSFIEADALGFLQELGFDISSYTEEQLKDEEFLNLNLEAQMAKRIFGDKKKVARAKISLDKVNSPEWQERKNKIIEELSKIGTSLDVCDQYQR